MTVFQDILLGNPRNSQHQPDPVALAEALDNRSAATPQDYGADGTAANDGPAFAQLFANNLNVRIPWINGGYNLGTQATIPIRTGQVIICEGATIRHGSDIAMFTADGVRDWAWIGATFAIGRLTSGVDYNVDGRTTAAGTTTTLVDSSFTAINDGGAATVYILSGPNNGETRSVVSTSGNTITVSPALPNATTINNDYKLISNECFMVINNCARYTVSGVQAQTFKGNGIRVQGDSALTTQRGDQGTFSDISALECTEGLWLRAGPGTQGSGAEYNTFTNTKLSGCITGVDLTAGNQSMTGGQIVDNNVGVFVRDGFNHAHGIVSSMNINHNTLYNLYTRDVTLGQSFNNCHFYANDTAGTASIRLENSKGIDLDGGHLDNWVRNIPRTDGGFNYIRNMYCPGTGGGEVRLINASNTAPSNLVTQGCYGPGAYNSGVSINDPGQIWVLARRIKGGGTQTISGSTVLQFNSELDLQDKQDAFSGTTFTVPTAQDGVYRVTIDVVITADSGLTTGGSTLDLRVNGTADRRVGGDLFGNTVINYNGTYDLELNATDTVDLLATMTGTNPVFGSAAYDSHISIVRIS